MRNILETIHIFLGLNAIGAGISVCVRMVAGRPFEKWVAHFLKLSVAAAAVGLILSIDHISLTQWLTAFGVYMSAFAILAWRKYNLFESWGPALVLSTMCVFCLDTVIAGAHVLKFMETCNLLSPSWPSGSFAVFMVAVVLLFAVLSTFAVKRLHPVPSEQMMNRMVR